MADSGAPIQPTRSGGERSAPQGAFQGTVTAVKSENGSQTLEIQSAQGRIKLQAEGDFQVGERLRVFMPQGGAVRLEKMAPLPGQTDWQPVGYQLPGNLDALKSVRAFEEQLAAWVGSRQPGAGAGAGKESLAQVLGGADRETLLRLPLPELLKRVLAREGGREMLMQALAALSKETFSSLMASLEEGRTDSSRSTLSALLRALRREIDNHSVPPATPPRGNDPVGAHETPDLGAYWPSRPGKPGAHGEASPWMGRVLERSDMGAPLAFAGGKPLALPTLPPNSPMPQKGAADPMFRYLLDLGGRTLEVQSAQVREAGDMVDFEMENGGARLQARFLDPAQGLPANLREAHAAGTPEAKAALQVAARYLAGFKDEPYFDRLVKDFGEVLAQGGRFALPEGGARLQGGQLPGPKELDGLLRLFVAFPRDAERPEQQARTWTQALKDPKAMLELLRAMRPEQDTSLLRAATPMRLAGAAGGPPGSLPGALPPELTALAAGHGEKEKAGEDALVALLRRVLPEGFRPPEVGDLARQSLSGGDILEGKEGKEAKAAQFMMQAFANLVPREEELREGRPNPFYFYHDQAWRGLQVTWERDRGSDGRAKRDKEAPVKVRVETEARHMGKVDATLVVNGGQATLDLRNQFHDVRGIMAEEMPELERVAALLGVRIEGWTCSQMQLEDTPYILPTAGWVRPASLDGGNLDLTG